MNWTGGSRNRVNIKNIKKNLEAYCEVQQSRNYTDEPEEKHNSSNANVRGNKNLSQDIIFLNMLMSQPPTPKGRKVTRLHLSTPKNKRGWPTCNIDLTDSPPSKMPKLQMLFPDIAPSISSEIPKVVSLEGTRESEADLNWGSKSAETQTEFKYFIDVGVQTEELYSEPSLIGKLETMV